MSFAKLLEIVKDNEEAVSLIKGLQSQSESLTKEVNRLEVVANEAIEKRNKIKSTVKSSLGIDEITEDALKALFSGNKGDDKSKAEIDNLQKQLAEAVKAKGDIESVYKQKIQSMNFEREVASLGIADEVIPSKLDYLNFRIQQGLSFNEDGLPVFFNDDGSTRYANGKPMSLRDRYNEILEKEPDLFKPSTKGGAGCTHQSSSGGKSFADMTEAEKVALYRRSPDEYRRLSQTK